MKIWRIVLASALPLLGAAALAGCFAPAEVATAPPPPPPPAPTTTAVVVTPPSPVVTQRVITYPEGRYELRGDGRVVAYYWMWAPTGMTYAFAPPPPPATTTVVVGRPVQRTIYYREGRYELYGDGVAVAYYWVWIPAGSVPPSPPPQPGS